jgi:uncharacterized protein
VSDASERALEVSLRTPMPASAEELFAWHERPGAFDRLNPAWMPAEVRARSGGIRDGARVTLGVPLGPLTTRWELEHVGYVAGREFRDVQRAGPFAHWEHVHRMEPAPEGSVLEDAISFAFPAPPFGRMVAGAFTTERLARLLRWRHALTRSDLERHAAAGAFRGKRIAVTGASGFIGQALVPFLRTGGHTVLTVGRGKGSDVRWVPAAGSIDAAALGSVDAVVHLAGATIAERWTAKRKRAIRESRVAGTRLIAEHCARMSPRPEVLVSSSAIGIYGSRGDELLDEASTHGDDFLAGIGREWEAATAPARDAGIRVVHLRTGIVLNPAGGALAKMLLPFQLGVGGRLGDGRQWMSWVSREDLVGAIHFLLHRTAITGAVNAVGPEPVTNAEFTETLGRVLRRPTILPVPAAALRLLFGEMAEGTVLASQRVRPTILERGGFPFRHRTLEEALRFELGLV